MPEDPLAGFDAFEHTHDGVTRQVFRSGTGPAVIVIHEVPGLHQEVIAFGRRVVDAGFTVFMPSLFGTPGKPFGWGYPMRIFPQVCVARELSRWPRTARARSRRGCERSRPTPTPSAAGRVSAPSACASPVASRSG